MYGHHGLGYGPRRFAHEFFRGPRGGGFARGGRRRMFDHGDLRLVILELIAEKPRHGYEIIKAIEERLGGAYSPSPGVVYPTLTLLEELGHAAVETDEGGRKLYRITEEGSQFREANRSTIDRLLERMAETVASRAGSHAPQIVRAAENLKVALRLRGAQGPLSDTTIKAIAAALDEAALAVERS